MQKRGSEHVKYQKIRLGLEKWIVFTTSQKSWKIEGWRMSALMKIHSLELLPYLFLMNS